MWTVGQREELAERTEWTWYLAGCLSWTTTQGECLCSSEGQSAGKTEQNRFPGNLGIGWVWVSGKCILLWLDLTPSVLLPGPQRQHAHSPALPPRAISSTHHQTLLLLAWVSGSHLTWIF